MKFIDLKFIEITGNLSPNNYLLLKFHIFVSSQNLGVEFMSLGEARLFTNNQYIFFSRGTSEKPLGEPLASRWINIV